MAFNVNVPVEKLRERSLFLGIPMFGGTCAGLFAKSIANLSTLCKHYGVKLMMHHIYNESLIPRARNYICDSFLRSDCTHMMFIDADIGFDPNDVILMLAMMSDDSPYDVLCGPYPKKSISWEKIKLAVDKGVADEDPNILERYMGDYVFNAADGTGRIPLNEPSEVLESGTGFMMIRRKTLEKFQEAYPEQMYRPDHVRTEHFDGSREICAFFDCPIDHKITHINKELDIYLKANPKATHKEILAWVKDPDASSRPYSKRYLSEDYYFCQWVRNIGLKVWLCPWMQLQHVGTLTFGGSLADLASIGSSATVDTSLLKKK